MNTVRNTSSRVQQVDASNDNVGRIALLGLILVLTLLFAAGQLLA